MGTATTITERLAALEIVALLTDIPAEGLARGQVGTVGEHLGDDRVLVDFSDDDGRSYAIVPIPFSALLPLRYMPSAA